MRVLAPNGQLEVVVAGFASFSLEVVHARSTNCPACAVVGGLVADDEEIDQLTAEAFAPTVVRTATNGRKLEPLVLFGGRPECRCCFGGVTVICGGRSPVTPHSLNVGIAVFRRLALDPSNDAAVTPDDLVAPANETYRNQTARLHGIESGLVTR
jgi:hypothetical protein